jgi:5-methyltetrahydrofolate--homocysteine methyltransferase
MDLSSLLQNPKIKLLDGAMGTQLEKYGLQGSGTNSIEHPDIVADIHKQYAQNGSRILITNTITMNRIYIETHKVSIDVKKVNLAAAKLARSAASEDRYVLGNIGPTGKLLKPYGEYAEAEFIKNYKEQAQYLEEGGVDGFIIETMFDLREAVCAVKGCKEGSSLPVIASMAFTTSKKGGRTLMGNSAQECAKLLTDEKVEAVGANCGEIGPFQMSEIIAIFKDTTTLPLVAESNAGKPKVKNSQTVFDMSPDDFASGMLECIRRGATLVGGCCGTTPDHIRALSEILKREPL